METTVTPKLVALQIVQVYRDGDVEKIKSLDIPIRDPYMAALDLQVNDYNIELSANVRIDPSYTIQYVIRDHQAVHEEDGKLHPYCDGINSDTDLDRKTGILRRSLEREKSVRTDLEA